MKYPNYFIYKGYIAKKTKYKGYYATKMGDIITIKVKGGQGKLDINKPRIHCLKEDKDGYLEACFSIMENRIHKRIYRRVHRVIWETFKGDIPNDLTIDHKNCKKYDNRLSNLRLLTREENTSIANKGKPSPKKKKYKLMYNDRFIGIFDKKNLCSRIGITMYDFYSNTPRTQYIHDIGYYWIEILESVEDNEKIS